MNPEIFSSDETSPEQFEVVQLEVVDELTDQKPELDTSRSSFWQNWIACINQHLQPGGKPVAVILSLGLISVPLILFSGSIWVGLILATSASIVAIRTCWM
ncbi:hypothetical protein NIES22_73100 (plasmid) [Calothrix brevissima NIES-22]|nr:hypothetical protein NIES22_73100 [Calothrix brevissima NIES-22]